MVFRWHGKAVKLRNSCFWLLTLAIRASLHTGRRQEPLAAAAVILAAESVGLRAPGRALALGALHPSSKTPAIAIRSLAHTLARVHTDVNRHAHSNSQAGQTRTS